MEIDALFLNDQGTLHHTSVHAHDVFTRKAQEEELQAANKEDGQQDRRRSRCEEMRQDQLQDQANDKLQAALDLAKED